MYKIGDKVMHRQEGACYIRQIVKMKMSQEEKQYFLLVPLINEKVCVYVSMDPDKQSNIRPVIEWKSLKRIVSAVNAQIPEWLPDASKRFAYHSKSIHSFDFQEMLLTIKCFSEREKLCAKDAQLLSLAQKLIFSEIAILLGVDYDRVRANPSEYIAY